jgi:hypothetical protein
MQNVNRKFPKIFRVIFTKLAFQFHKSVTG